LYSQTSLRELLESTYRRRRPVIGISAALVAAGTLAPTHNDAQRHAAPTGRVLDQIAARRNPLRVTRPVESVARALDVVVDDATRSLGDRP
jgi:ABC-type uncharacterized transport system substrate-binding protein